MLHFTNSLIDRKRSYNITKQPSPTLLDRIDQMKREALEEFVSPSEIHLVNIEIPIQEGWKGRSSSNEKSCLTPMFQQMEINMVGKEKLVQNKLARNQYTMIENIVGFIWAPVQTDCQVYIIDDDNHHHIFPFLRIHLPSKITRQWAEDQYEQVNLNDYFTDTHVDYTLVEIFLKLLVNRDSHCMKTVFEPYSLKQEINKRQKYSREIETFSDKKTMVTNILYIAKIFELPALIKSCLIWFNCAFEEEEFDLPDDCIFIFTKPDQTINSVYLKTIKSDIRYWRKEGRGCAPCNPLD